MLFGLEVTISHEAIAGIRSLWGGDSTSKNAQTAHVEAFHELAHEPLEIAQYAWKDARSVRIHWLGEFCSRLLLRNNSCCHRRLRSHQHYFH